MSNTLRTAFRRKLLAFASTPLLLGSVAATAIPTAAADQVYYKETFYSTAAQTTVVGIGYGYCDGDYIMASGYQTQYVKYKFIAPCP
jgi:hypothetical protein